METQRHNIGDRCGPSWIEAKAAEYGEEPWVKDWKKEQYALLAAYAKADEGATAATGWVAESALLDFSRKGIASRQILEDHIVIEFGRFWSNGQYTRLSGDRVDGDGYEPCSAETLEQSMSTLAWMRERIRSSPRHEGRIIGVKVPGLKKVKISVNGRIKIAVLVPGTDGEFCRMRWRLRNVVTGMIITDVKLGYENERQDLFRMSLESQKAITEIMIAQDVKKGPWRTC